MKTYSIGILVILLLFGTLVATAQRTPLTPEQRMQQRKFEAEEYRKQIESGQRRPSRFAERQKRTADTGYTPSTSRYIAIAVDDKYCYVLTSSGQINKIAKTKIRERK